MSSSAKDPWVWDYATAKYVRWHYFWRRWQDQDGRAAREPQRTPNPVPNVALPSSWRSDSTTRQIASINNPISGSIVPDTTAAVKAATRSSQPSFDRGAAATSPAQIHGARSTAPYAATISDPSSGVKTRWEVSETTQYKDPVNANSNRSLNLKRIRGVEGRQDKFGQTQQNEYKVYRVIEVLLVPPEEADSNVSRITPTGAGGVRLRRFVIVREIPDRACVEALPIKTYNFRGVAAPRVIKSHHSIIYTGNKRPFPTPDELPGRNAQGVLENGMQAQAIRIVTFDRGKALDPMARLDYADRYEFEWGVPNMRLFGRVHEDSQAALSVQYNSVWSTIITVVQGAMPATQPSGHSSGTNSGVLTITPGSDGTRASSTVANYGSSRGDATGSSASGPTASNDGASQELLLRYASPSSGPCTEEQLMTLFKYLQEYARRHGLPVPPVHLNAHQLTGLSRNADARSRYIQQIRDRWRQTISNDDDDEDEDEDEDEEDDDDDDDDEDGDN